MIHAQSLWKTAGAASHNPFVLLLLGAAITNYLFPELNKRATRNELAQQERLRIAFHTLDQGSQVDSKLNLILSNFEAFHKDQSRLAGQLQMWQSRLRTDTLGLYRDFDQQAWWWFADLDVQAASLGLDAKPLLELTQSYRSNLTETIGQIDKIWKMLLSQEYRPDDPSVTDRMMQIRKDLAKLGLERRKIIRRIAQIFFSTT